MEILKQRQYEPMSVEDEVFSLYVAVKDHLSDVDVASVRQFEEEWLRFLHTQHAEIVEAMRDRMEFTDEITESLEKAVGQFKERFGG